MDLFDYKPRYTHGITDDYCYNIMRDPVHVHDLNATILHCLGVDHTKLTFKYQGRHHRLTDVHGNVQPTAAELEDKLTFLEDNSQFPRKVRVS